MAEQNNTIEGKVCRKTTNVGIDGIQIKADGYSVSYTYDGGMFALAVPVQESYHLEFEDVDGESNGGKFKKQEIDTAGTAFLTINIELE
jgi:hypothetical protein